MTTYSYSKLTNYQNCPLRYKYTYLDKQERDFENTIESILGTAVHHSFEKLYNDLKKGKLDSLEEILKFYKKEWSKLDNKNIVIVKTEFKKTHYKKLGIKYITNYYNRFYPFDEDFTVGIESKVELDLFNDKRYILIGYIDRLAIKGKTLRIHDYKTSSTLPTNEEINNNKQLALYAMALKDKYQDINKIELIWHYLAFDKDLIVEKKEEDYEKIKQEIKLLIDEIENTDIDKFKPKASALCNWCEFASICPIKKHIVKVRQMSLEQFDKDYGVKLTTKFAKLTEEQNILNRKIKETEKEIYDYLKRENIKILTNGIKTMTLYEKTQYKAPAKTSLRYSHLKILILEQKLFEYLKVDEWELSKSINSGIFNEKLTKELIKLLDKNMFRKLYLR